MNIVEVLENSPAIAARLRTGHTRFSLIRPKNWREGDHIWAIDGVQTDNLSLAEATDRIRGEIGTPVSITIRRSGVELTVSLVRESSHYWGN